MDVIPPCPPETLNRVGSGLLATDALSWRGRASFALWAPTVAPWIIPLLLFLAALVLRLPSLGNPVVHVDEEFYLLGGDRLLHGTLPFVDLWDRKPFGLFLLYAGIRLLGGEGIVQYQLVAAAAAALTAVVIARIAQRFAPPRGALVAGLAYLVWLQVLGGEGGQSPVFYNLPMAVAALMTLEILQGHPVRLLRRGCAVMLLAGLAMQIKYTAVFEGVFFGCALLLAAWRAGWGWSRLGAAGVAWIACALLPTATVLLFYGLIGQGEAFVYANFLSVFLRAPPPEGSALARLGKITAYAAPLLLCGVLSRWPRPVEITSRPGAVAAQNFVVAWAGASIGGILVFGTYYDHYALPMLAPLAAAGAPRLAFPGLGTFLRDPFHHGVGRALATLAPVAALSTGLIMGLILHAKHERSRGDGHQVRAIADYLRPRLRDCLFVFDGEPILYHLTGSCLPTRYSFPSHLSDRKEAGATGVVPEQEVARILTMRPEFIVSTNDARPRNNPATWGLVAQRLHLDYHPVLTVPVGRQNSVVYRRNDAD